MAWDWACGVGLGMWRGTGHVAWDWACGVGLGMWRGTGHVVAWDWVLTGMAHKINLAMNIDATTKHHYVNWKGRWKLAPWEWHNFYSLL